jgi:hypothetical protein
MTIETSPPLPTANDFILQEEIMNHFMTNSQNHWMRMKRIFLHTVACFCLLWFGNGLPAIAADTAPVPPVLFFCVGDSLSHGTMDATNNYINTSNAYVQKVVGALAVEIPLAFRQPYFDVAENRLQPFRVPTNLGVDGSDIFSLIGLQYYKRAGTDVPFFNPDLLADESLPANFKDKYDKVLYPINLLAQKPVSQLSSAIWLLREGAPLAGIEAAMGIFWEGNNDSSLAALGTGGRNPMFQPLPFDIVKSELKPALRLLLGFGESSGVLSFEPYTLSAIERNLTEIDDFRRQYELVIKWLDWAGMTGGVSTDILLLTLPYYSAVGYLMDSEDIEFYLQKVNPAYTVPASFKRVAEPGEPITDPLKGDRISLLTFGMMYVLLSSGHSVEEVNRALETDGLQRDGLVLSEEEQVVIMTRIDAFNAAIKTAAASGSPNIHILDIGQFLNDALTGKIEIIIDGHRLNRKWIRGGAFSLDGVHPGYVGQALIANAVLEHLNALLGLNADLYDLSEILANDPYIDRDEDGWASGPQYVASGMTELLFLFKDPDDTDPQVQVAMPPDVWDLISDILLEEILQIPAIEAEAKRLNLKAEHEQQGRDGMIFKKAVEN